MQANYAKFHSIFLFHPFNCLSVVTHKIIIIEYLANETQFFINTDFDIGHFLFIRFSRALFNLSRYGVGVFLIFKSPKVRERFPSN